MKSISPVSLKKYLPIVALFLASVSISLSISGAEAFLIIFIIWLVAMLIYKKENIFKTCPYFLPLLIYWITTLPGYFFGSEFAILKGNLFDVWTMLYFLIGFYLVKEHSVRWILMGLILGSTILAGAVIYQTLFLGVHRAAGFLSIYMTTGNVLAMAVVIIFTIIISGYESKRFMIIYLLALIIIFAGLIFTGTRGALLAFIIAASIMLVIQYGKKGILFAVILVTAIMPIIIFTGIGERFIEATANFNDYTTSHGWRILLWKNSIQIFKEYPVFGIGNGAFESLMTPLMPKIDTLPKSHAHSGYLQQLVLFGVLGLIAFLYYHGRIALDLLSKVRENRYAMIGFAVTIVYLIEALTENSFMDSEVVMYFSLLAGTMLGATYNAYKDKLVA